MLLLLASACSGEGVGAVVVGCLALAGAVAFMIRAWCTRPRPPRGWKHVGQVPAGAEIATQAVLALYPEIAGGGTVEWVAARWWKKTYDAGEVLVSGEVVDFVTRKVRCLNTEPLDEGPLSEEVTHLAKGGNDQSAEFQAQVAAGGNAIRAALIPR